MSSQESMAWALKNWPEPVYPHSSARARTMFYKHRASLVKGKRPVSTA
jgi:hypothetical protein